MKLSFMICVMQPSPRCDAKEPCVVPRIYLFSLILLFTITAHITVHSNPNLDFHLCFHSKTLLILVPFVNPIIPIIFSPIPHQNLTLILQNPSYTRSASGVLNQILLFPLVLHHLTIYRPSYLSQPIIEKIK